jgi:hypothetical protein
VTNCPEDFRPNSDNTDCVKLPVIVNPPVYLNEPSEFPDFPIVYFPFTGVAVFFIIISFLSKLKERTSMFLSNALVLLGFEEFLMVLAQIYLSYYFKADYVFYATSGAFIFLLISNFTFLVMYFKKIKKDPAY